MRLKVSTRGYARGSEAREHVGLEQGWGSATRGCCGALAWCGVFVLWVLRMVGLTTRKWVSGRGFIYIDAQGHSTAKPWLPIVAMPAIGDIAYFDQPYQHYALVEEVEGARVHLIAGNTPNVSRSVVPLAKATAYYSIAPLLPSQKVA